ncbi:unnamed protein product [Ilex paraguariensis]|uniref:DUF630 domain-containing protein n=1 Tax=Ilex paraguariensis TaxID=185542 RepID=A0ABC8SIF7_9AQUA
MGCCYSRIEREEMVSRCKSRKRYMKQFVKARQVFSASHSMYIRSLRSTGSALLQFATGETTLHHPHTHNHNHHHLPPFLPSPPPLPPTPPPPMSPTTDTWTTSTATSSALPPPPPPPPPPPSSSWDFWDPFVPSSSRSVNEEEWEATTIASEVAVTTTVGTTASVAAPPSAISRFSKETTTTELAVVVSTKSKDLTEIIKELDEYFLSAADAGSQVSLLLEVPTCGFSAQRSSSGKVYGYGKNLSPLLRTWGSSPKWNNGFGKLGEEVAVGNLALGGVTSSSHCSTVERFYAWEKKLYTEVKNAETLKMEHEKRAAQLRKLEMRRAEYVKTEKAKKEVEKLESRMMVASQAIETTSAEIIKLRESELYPQLSELVKGGTWSAGSNSAIIISSGQEIQQY